MEGLPKNVVLGIHKVKKSCSKTFHEAKKQAENVRFADISNLDKKDYSKKVEKIARKMEIIVQRIIMRNFVWLMKHKRPEKENYDNPLNVEFWWQKNELPSAKLIQGLVFKIISL